MRGEQFLDILPLEAREAPIIVIGAGATGSCTVLPLAKMGFVNIQVWDDDIVEEHNVDNQLYGYPHIGEVKVLALTDIIMSLTGVQIHPVPRRFTSEDGFARVRQETVVIFAVDSIDVRKALWRNTLSTMAFRALIDTRMAAEVFNVYTIDPKSAADHKMYEQTWFEENQATAPRCTAKSIMYTPFILGGFTANQVKKVLTNEPLERYICFGMKYNQLVMNK